MAEKLAIKGGKRTIPKGMDKPWPPITQADINAVVKVLKRGILWGPTEEEVTGLQKEFAEYIGAMHALVVNSGTAALHACVCACGIEPGDEVITPAFSFWATAQAILAQNGIPVFVDIDPETMNMDPGAIEAKITDRTKALLPVHVHGLPADMNPINAIAKKHKLKVIEDAAQAHGATYKGRKAGILGDIAGFSLNGSKNLPAGEGGIVTTNDPDLYERARMMSMFGEKSFPKGAIRLYDAQIMGFNYRNNEMADAFCRSFLKRFDSLQTKRARNCEYLNRELAKIPGVKVPSVPKDYTTSWHLYRIRLYPEALGITDIHPKRFRWGVQKALFAEGVDLFEWHDKPVPAQTIFLKKDAYGKGAPWTCSHSSRQARNMVYDPNDYPKTIDMFDRSFCIEPIYPPNGLELMGYIVEAFRKVFNRIDQVVEFAKTIEVPMMPQDIRKI